jgi:hypothetical protein
MTSIEKITSSMKVYKILAFQDAASIRNTSGARLHQCITNKTEKSSKVQINKHFQMITKE